MTATVTDLEEYRATCLATAAKEVAADEAATGAQLVAQWEASLYRSVDPTYAHLEEIAAVCEDALTADSYEDMRAALVQNANGARLEMERRVGRARG